MVLEKFGAAFKNAMKKIASAVFVDKSLIDSIIKELKRSLLEADMDYDLVQKLCEKIRQSALEEKSSLEKKEQIIKLIHDEMVSILGSKKYELPLNKKPTKIMFLGLYGTGKTTTIAKLAFYYSKRGFKTCMIGLDVHRPAAPEQLEQLAEQANVPVFINKEEKNALKIWKQFESQANKFDIVLIDTAGRDAVDSSLLEEIKELQKAIKPEQAILAMSADIGQTAKKQVSEFKKACNINGVIITRMDSSAKGGGALIACSETSSPVLFITTGEKLPDIEAFNPTSFVSRLLGMGDLEALLEKAKTAMESEKQKTIAKNIGEGKFTLLEFYEQIKSMQSLGPLSKITELIPGLSGLSGAEEMLEGQEGKMRRWRYAINSMTQKEIEEPETITSERITRISKGSHVLASDIREMLNQHKLLKQFLGKGKSLDIESMKNPADMKKLASSFSQKQLRKMAKKFKGF